MTRSYSLKHHPEADWSPNDIEPMGSYSWDDFADEETNADIMLNRVIF